MYAFLYDDAAASRFMSSIRSGRPMVPSALGWTRLDMMTAVGTLLGALSTHGPDMPGSPRTLHPEHAEAISEDFEIELLGAARMSMRRSLPLLDQRDPDEEYPANVILKSTPRGLGILGFTGRPQD